MHSNDAGAASTAPGGDGHTWRLQVAIACAELYDWFAEWLAARVRHRAHDLLLGVPHAVLPPDLLGHALFPEDAAPVAHAPHEHVLLAYLVPLVPTDHGCELVLAGVRDVAPVPGGGLRLWLWFGGPPPRRFFADLLHDTGTAHLGVTTSIRAALGTWPAAAPGAPLALAAADVADAPGPPRESTRLRYAAVWRVIRTELDHRNMGELVALLARHGFDVSPDTVRRVRQHGLAGAFDP